MDPDFTCFSSWGYRLLAAVVLERLGHLLVRLVTSRVAKVSPALHAELEMQANRRARAIQDGLLPTLPNGLQANLQTIFELYVRACVPHTRARTHTRTHTHTHTHTHTRTHTSHTTAPVHPATLVSKR